jgi:hypothetical protein
VSDPEKRGEEQELTPEELESVKCFYEPDGTICREFALTLVQDSVIQFLTREVVNYTACAWEKEEAGDLVTAKDMKLCAEVAEQVIQGLAAANTAVLALRKASQRRVVVPGASVIPISKGPRSLQ